MNNTERNILVTKSLPYILNKPLGINLEKWNYQLLKILEIYFAHLPFRRSVSVCVSCVLAVLECLHLRLLVPPDLCFTW